MLVRILSVLSSSATLLGLVISLHPPSAPISSTELFIIVLAVGFTLMAIGSDLRDHFANCPKAFRTKRQIRDYMYAWVEGGGKVCIFSNDLSWVDDAEMVTMLTNKAAKGDLQLCIPKSIPIAEQLKSAGATVLTYSHLKVVPQSRFTIVNCGRLDAQVAVGRRLGNKHVVEEFGAGDHPVFSVAVDLVDVLTRYNETRRAN